MYNISRRSSEIADRALMAVGIDVGSGERKAGPAKFITDGPAVATAIQDLADQAADATREHLMAEAQKYSDVPGITSRTIDAIKAFAMITSTQELETAQAIASVKALRANITNECDLLEKAMKKIRQLDPHGLAKDLQALNSALALPNIHNIIRIQSDSKQ